MKNLLIRLILAGCLGCIGAMPCQLLAHDEDWVDLMAWLDMPYMSAAVWVQDEDDYEETGFDEAMWWRAKPKLVFTQGRDVFYEYGVFDFGHSFYEPVTISCEIDTGKTGVYRYEWTATANDDNVYYFRVPFEAVEGFPTIGGLGSYTLTTTVSCESYDPGTVPLEFQVDSLSLTSADDADESISLAFGKAGDLEALGYIDFPQRDYGTSGNKWFASLLDPRNVSPTGLFAQSGLCGKGQTSVLDMRVFEPFRLTFSSGVTGGKLEFVTGVNGNYQQRTMSCGNGTYSAVVGTNDAEWVRWVFTRGDGEYRLDEACYAAVGKLEFEPLCHVSFDSNGGTSECPPVWAVRGKSYDSIEPFPEKGPAPPEPVKDSCGCLLMVYEFDGWYLGEERVTGESITPEAPVATLFARWKENRHPLPKNGERPNLVVNLTTEPTNGTLEDRFKFEVTISNVGDWDAGPFWTRLYLDGEKFSPDMYSECLAVGRQRVRHRRRRGTSLGPGTHVMKVVVDSADSVTESDEGDNSSSCTFTVREIRVPDILVDFEFATPPGRKDSFYLSTDENGETVVSTFSSCETNYLFLGVRNAEKMRVAPAVVSFVLKRGATVVGEEEYSWDAITEGNVVEIAADDRKFAFLQDLEAGDYTLKCTLDPDNAYAETDETDNVRTIAFTVVDCSVKVLVSFDANGGACSVKSKVVSYGNEIGTLPTAMREGCVFLGWFTDADGGRCLTTSSIVTEDLVLYAHWQERSPVTPTPNIIMIEKPTAVEGLVYTGAEEQGVKFDARLSFVGDVKATNAGSYEATFSLPADTDTEIFMWMDGATDAITVVWNIAPMQQELKLTVGEALGVADIEWSVYDPVDWNYELALDQEWTWDRVCSVKTDSKAFRKESPCGIRLVVNGPTTMRFRYSKSYSAGKFYVYADVNNQLQFLYKDLIAGVKTGWQTVTVAIPAGTQAVKIWVQPGDYEKNAKNEYNGFWIDGLEFGDFSDELTYVIDYDVAVDTGIIIEKAHFKTKIPTSYTKADLPLSLANIVPVLQGYTFQEWLLNGVAVDEIPVGTTGKITLLATWKKDGDPESDDSQVATRDVPLVISQGWNWLSLNVAPTNASLGAVFAGVSFADEDMVKSADGVATYYGGSWYGDLTALKPGVAYMVKKSTAGMSTVAVTGAAADTAVSVAAGWNWIGCTATEEVPRDALSHSGGFADEDMISSADGVATYYGGKWYGALKVLKPGVGYKAKFAKGGTLTFGNVEK